MASGRVVILEQFAHMDWDWQEQFDALAPGAVKIYRDVNAATIKNAAAGRRYPYSVCEMSFLRYFAEHDPDEFEQMFEKDDVTVVGGAITSPDNLLTNGECFFRAFLVGLHWMKTQELEWSRMVWLPDDFGHDSQLPVLLVAMGAGAVGFSRVPGDDQAGSPLTTARPLPIAADILNQPADGVGGQDFHWQAADGSTIFAHWLPHMYWQAGGIGESADITMYRDQNAPGAPSRYIHVPVGGDFQRVNADVPAYAAEWKDPDPGDDQAVVGSFAYYVERVKEEVAAGRARLKTRTFRGDPANAEATAFRSNPYFMGFYASRMELKTLHHETTRLLVQAEVLDAACAAAGRPRSSGVVTRLLDAWNNLAPSTHHDYITGTAVDSVYLNEQLVLSRQVQAEAQQLRSDIVGTIKDDFKDRGYFVAFNTLGWKRAGVVQMDDGALVWAHDTPAMGWSLTFNEPPPVSVSFGQIDDNDVQMSNGIVSVTISRSANWGISSFRPSGSSQSILSGTGNALRFWTDNGSIYVFGYECSEPNFSPAAVTQRAVGTPQTSVSGRGRDLSASVTVQLEVAAGNTLYRYTLTYTLNAGDPFVTISITGAAPPNTAVFVDFPFKGGPISEMEHGTPYHWDTKTPGTFGTGQYQRIFEPTHDFVSVWNGDTPLGAIYHGGVPAWAIDGSTLTGCILRNTPTADHLADFGATGTDSDPHTITFALRLGEGLQHAATGAPLREARGFTNPLFGLTSSDGTGALPIPYSLASWDDALLTVAKRGTTRPDELFLRLYKPANTVQVVEATVAAPFSSVRGATAVERPLTAEEEEALAIRTDPGRIRLTASNAVTTLRLLPPA